MICQNLAAMFCPRRPPNRVGADFDQSSLVLDGLHYARRVPLFPVGNVIDLAEIAALRNRACAANFLGRLVCESLCPGGTNIIRRCGACIIRWPWPAFGRVPASTAMVVVNRQFHSEDRICWGRLEQPEARSLIEFSNGLKLSK